MSSEATGKNWRTRASWWAAEEWQSKKGGSDGNTAKGSKEREECGFWQRDISREERKGKGCQRKAVS